MEGRECAQNYQKEQCPHDLAGQEAASGKHNRCHGHNNAQTHPEIGWRAKQYGYREGNRRYQRYEARQDTRFRLQLRPVVE